MVEDMIHAEIEALGLRPQLPFRAVPTCQGKIRQLGEVAGRGAAGMVL